MFSFLRPNPNKLLFLDSAYLLTIDGEPVGVRVKVKSGYYDVSFPSLRGVGFPLGVLLLDNTPIRLSRVPLYLVKGTKNDYRTRREQGLGRKAFDCSEDFEICRLISMFLQAFLHQINVSTIEDYPLDNKTKKLFLKTIIPNHGRVVVGENDRRVRLGVTFYDPEQSALNIFVRHLPSNHLYLFNFSSLHCFLSSPDDVRSYNLSIVR